MTTPYVDWDKVYEVKGQCGEIGRKFGELLSEDEERIIYRRAALMTDKERLHFFQAKLKELTGTDDPAKVKPKN